MQHTGSIRIAARGDLDAVLAIAGTTPWDKAAYLTDQLARGNVLVSGEPGSVDGFIAWNREFFAFPFVWLVAVAPARRRRGIASALFDAVERNCADLRIYSSTNESHAAMHRFFERRGYRRAGSVDVDPGDAEVFYCLR